MAPNLKSSGHSQFSSEIGDAGTNCEDTATKTNFDVPLDQEHPVRLGKLGSYIVGGISLSIYAYAIFVLFNDYSTNYFRKVTDPASVPNHLRAWAPLYGVAILMEGMFAYLKGMPVYKTGDTFCSMLTFVNRGIVQRMLSMSVLCYSLYGVIWDNYGQYIHATVFPQVIQESALVQFACIIILDEFVYYWVHRFGHTVNAFWNFHQVHHNGEVFNLFTGIRNSVLVRFSTIMFYLPLALLFDPPVFIIFRQFNLVYQFWIHNEYIGKLGWLEYILNTPSQHRVHHGRAAYCIDTNFGGMTCIFDRLFGTYQEELEEVPVVYGLTTSITTLCPWKLNIYPWINTFKSMNSVSGLKAKFLCLYDGPGRIPGSNPREEYPIPPITNNTFQVRNPIFSTSVKLLLIFEITLGIIVFSVINNRFDKEPENYWYFTALLIHCGYAMYSAGAVTDRITSSLFSQLVSVVSGVCLYSYGSIMRYHPEIFVRTAAEITVYCGVGFFVALLVLANKQEIRTPLSESEIGKDLPLAKEAEAAQWAHYHNSLKQKVQ